MTKEQALKDIERVYGPTEDPDEAWSAYDRVRSFIEQSQPVPEGFVLVPVEPTDEMLESVQKARCCHALFEEFMHLDGDEILTDWRAMLAAAPKPEKSPNGHQEQIDSAKRTMQEWPLWMGR